MTTTREAMLRARQAQLEAEYAKVEAELEREQSKEEAVARFGEDDFRDGDIIAWDKQFISGRGVFDNGRPSKVYHYVAIKCNGMWYASGYSCDFKRTWASLVEFILMNAWEVPTIYQVTALEEII